MGALTDVEIRPATSATATATGAAAGALSLAPRPPIASLAESDFRLTAPKLRKQCIVLAYGGTKVGKTTFVTRYAPDPVALLSFDHRAEPAIVEAVERLGRRIYWFNAELNTSLKLSEASKYAAQLVTDKVARNVEVAVRENERGNVRTLALDTGTEYNDILHLAYDRLDGKRDFGKADGMVNLEWRNIFTLVRESGIHLVLLARDKAIYDGQEATGEYTYKGPPVMAEGVDFSCHLRINKDSEKSVRKIGEAPKFELKIADAGLSAEQRGRVYGADEWEAYGGPFVYASMMMYGGKPQDWR